MVKAFVFLLVLVSACAPAFAVDAYIGTLYKQIDIAFVHKSDSELNSILAGNMLNDDYYLIENYTMKKIRRLLISEDYQFAMDANLVVIDNNLDNAEAVEMYSTIASALEKQREQERELEERRLAELARFEAEKERKRGVVNRNFDSVTTTSGDSVYVQDKNLKYSAWSWMFRFGMFNGVFVSDSGSGYNSFRYGISGDFTYEYVFDKLMVGFDVGGEAVILPFYNGDDTMLGSVSIVPKIGFTNFSRKLFLRAGFASFIMTDTMANDEKDTALHGTVCTPVFGIGFNHVKVGPAVLFGNVDYYLGHLAYSDLKSAFGGSVNANIPFAVMEKVKLGFTIGVKDTVFIKSSGIENKAGLVLAIGAENVAK